MKMSKVKDIKAAIAAAKALGATHYQRWESLYQGHWILSSVAFYQMDADDAAEGHQIEVATWSAGLQVLSAERRQSIYAAGLNAKKASRDLMSVSAAIPIK